MTNDEEKVGCVLTHQPLHAACPQTTHNRICGPAGTHGHRLYTGQTPVLKYNRALMQAILYDRLPIAKIVNATVISLDQAPDGYRDFDSGVAKKFVLDPHGVVGSA